MRNPLERYLEPVVAKLLDRLTRERGLELITALDDTKQYILVVPEEATARDLHAELSRRLDTRRYQVVILAAEGVRLIELSKRA